MDRTRFSRNRYLVVGRAGMDLYAEPASVAIEMARSYWPALGGSAANIAAGLCRLGGEAALMTALSDDAVGRYVQAQLLAYGVDTRFAQVIQGEPRTSLAVVETRPENCQSVIYRNNAADFQLAGDTAADADLAAFGALIVTGTALAVEPSRSVVETLMRRAADAEMPVVIDLDYRPYSWPSTDEARRVCLQAAELADIVVGNDVEFDLIAGRDGGGLGLAESLAGRAGVIAIHKLGERGLVSFNGGGRIDLPVFQVQALKPTGAGDAFLAGFCSGFATGHDLAQSLRRGAAAAAIVVTRRGCAPASPAAAELDGFLASQTMK